MSETPSDRLRTRFGEQAVPLYDFVESALYEAGCGYYADSQRSRIGKSFRNDFYTANSLGTLFRELVADAARKLAGEDFCRKAAFIEIGCEAGESVNCPEGFARYRPMPLGTPLALEGLCVVFSNELLDAQPFDQMVWHEGIWQFSAVHWNGMQWEPCLLPPSACSRPLPSGLPEEAPEAYVLDVPTGAEALTRELTTQAWEGLWIAFDYGKDWLDLTRNHPAGTARAYHKHRQHNALVENPGEQDITHHVCWDRLESILQEAGFADIQTRRQEAFFMTHAQERIAAVLNAPQEESSRGKLAELLHPAHMGTKFQVLSAFRDQTKSSLHFSKHA